MDGAYYPIGTQSFENLRNDKCIYVDKTFYIYKLAHGGSRTYFLSRPRRFGKSLFLSTLSAYFSGKKELFQGLYIYDKESEWKSYPILHFDFSGAEATSCDKLKSFIHNHLQALADKYGVKLKDPSMGLGPMFGFLIKDISEKTQSQVVILIDEYDKGIIDALDNEEQLIQNQELLRPFFSQLKLSEPYMRFCFITGVARFRHYTIFSGFNNPDDISLEKDYAAICGITFEELEHNFQKGLQGLAEELHLSQANTIEALKLKYDGYRFTRGHEMVFNPFSLLNCLKKKELGNFWIKSGTSKIFLSFLTKSRFNIETLSSKWICQERLEAVFSTDDPIALLFQTGYLTIKDYDDGYYRLDIPNGEVKRSLIDELIPHYMNISNDEIPMLLRYLKQNISTGNVDGFMTILQSMVAKTPFHQFDYTNIEKTYHLIIYQIFLLLGIETRSEICVSGGRIDMVASTSEYIYVMEFKLDGKAQDALNQINQKGYALSWNKGHRKVIKIGACFSSASHTINDWLIE